MRPCVAHIPWNELPIRFRRRWWRAYGFHPPARPEQAAEHVQTWLSRPGGWSKGATPQRGAPGLAGTQPARGSRAAHSHVMIQEGHTTPHV